MEPRKLFGYASADRTPNKLLGLLNECQKLGIVAENEVD